MDTQDPKVIDQCRAFYCFNEGRRGKEAQVQCELNEDHECDHRAYGVQWNAEGKRVKVTFDYEETTTDHILERRASREHLPDPPIFCCR